MVFDIHLNNSSHVGFCHHLAEGILPYVCKSLFVTFWYPIKHDVHSVPPFLFRYTLFGYVHYISLVFNFYELLFVVIWKAFQLSFCILFLFLFVVLSLSFLLRKYRNGQRVHVKALVRQWSRLLRSVNIPRSHRQFKDCC